MSVGLITSILVSNEYGWLDWVFVGGHGILLDLIFFFGLVVILAIHRGRVPQEVTPFQLAPTKSLSRFQLARTHIFVTAQAFFIYWSLSLLLLAIQQYGDVGVTKVVGISPFTALVPVSLLLIFPFVSLLAHAMCGNEDDEIVDSPAQLRAIIFPCIGVVVFIWSLTGVINNFGMAYREYDQFSFTVQGLLALFWGDLLWPAFKFSLGLI